MRLFVAAVAFLICLWPLAGAQSLVASASDAASSAPAPAPGAVDSGTASADAAAARHAKRTECLKQAKLKKLVGAQKNAFIKECVATP
jgi:hypothetical protein